MTAPPPIGVHLHSARREARDDLEGVLRRLAEIGYLGVEVEGLHGMAPDRFRALTAEVGLQVISVSVEEDGPAATAAAARELGAGTVVDGFYDLDPNDLRDQLDALNAAVAECAPQGMRFAYHNHEREFTHDVDGRRAWDVIVDELDPRVVLEVDYSHAALYAGVDPVELLGSVGERARLLHVRDATGPDVDDVTPVGSGRFDISAILAAAPVAEWHVVEHESRANVLEGIAESYRYLVGNGFSRGRV
jgi:sugar phosphate isomerase/epimerase